MSVVEKDELYHYGVKNMKWGVRNYQNKDGSLTSAGRRRYQTDGDDDLRAKKQAYKSAKKDYSKAYNKAYNYSRAYPISQYTNKKKSAEADRRWDDAINKADTLNKAKSDYKQAKKEYKETNKEALAAKRKKAAMIGAAAVGTALAVYGTYKVADYVKNNKQSINAGKRRAEQIAYLQRNINNIQSHVDPASKLYKSERYNHALQSTINSRKSSIAGDRSLYGPKSVAGRDAVREAREFMYEALRRGDYDKYM